MDRRKFLGGVAVTGAAATTIAAPAIAQSAPEVKWRLASSFPKSLDTIFGASDTLAKYVSEATDGKFQIQVFAGGELVPPLQVLDAVQNGTVEIGHTAMYYYIGKDPTFAFSTTMPFGLNERNQTAWLLYGGGLQLYREFLTKYKVISFMGGSTGAQMGGWFRKEIKSVEDLKGLKFRMGGFAGKVLTKLGVVPQQIAGGDIYPSLEKGTIDAAEWIGPYDDEKLGFNKVAPYYYYPGWWEGGAQLDFIVGTDKWNALPKNYKAIFEAASQAAHNDMRAKYDARNPQALKRLAQSGTQFRPFPRDVMMACYEATFQTYEEESAKSADFKKIYDSFLAFREDANLWFKFAENTFDNFVFHNPTPKKK